MTATGRHDADADGVGVCPGPGRHALPAGVDPVDGLRLRFHFGAESRSGSATAPAARTGTHRAPSRSPEAAPRPFEPATRPSWATGPSTATTRLPQALLARAAPRPVPPTTPIRVPSPRPAPPRSTPSRSPGARVPEAPLPDGPLFGGPLLRTAPPAEDPGSESPRTATRARVDPPTRTAVRVPAVAGHSRHGAGSRHGRPGARNLRPTPALAAAVLGLAGLGILGFSVTHTGPPAPSSAASVGALPLTPTTGSEAPAVPAVPAARVAAPVSLSVPAIDVDTPLIPLGLQPDRTVEVPPHAPPGESRAGWYENSPPPGATGPAVLLGHVDSAKWGPAVFYELGALDPGDTITVGRADGTSARFRVDRVISASKDAFPTQEVYGNTADPELRLITCGGAFDASVRSYENNIIVFASMIPG